MQLNFQSLLTLPASAAVRIRLIPKHYEWFLSRIEVCIYTQTYSCSIVTSGHISAQKKYVHMCLVRIYLVRFLHCVNFTCIHVHVYIYIYIQFDIYTYVCDI